jgi:hypothetical protein
MYFVAGLNSFLKLFKLRNIQRKVETIFIQSAIFVAFNYGVCHSESRVLIGQVNVIVTTACYN